MRGLKTVAEMALDEHTREVCIATMEFCCRRLCLNCLDGLRFILVLDDGNASWFHETTSNPWRVPCKAERIRNEMTRLWAKR